jgi:hypothetical protein
MGRIMPPFRQLYQESVSDLQQETVSDLQQETVSDLQQETVSDLQKELKAALVDLRHKSTFDRLLKEEVAALGNSTLPTLR